MSSEVLSTLRGLSTAAAAILVVAALSACQVRPLYADATGPGTRLADIGFSEAGDRVEQVVRNQLIFLTSGGEGEALNPRYRVELQVVSAYSDILDDEDARGIQPGRVVVSASYTISRVVDGQLLKTANRRATALLDVSSQEFAELRAVRDAEDRAAKELAEVIRADLAIALAKEPPPQVTWQK